MRATGFRIGLAAMVALLVLAGVALADIGDLTPRNCIDDNDTGTDTCSASVNGMQAPTGVAVSADGKSVYVASTLDDAIVQFERITTNGRLAPLGCIDDNDTGGDNCAQSVDGLGNPTSVAVSPDGKSVYATSGNDDAVVRFARNTTTGELTPAGCIDDNDTGPEACAQTADGLDIAISVVVSNDNKSVYATSLGDDAVVRFARNTTTGALTPQGCVDDNDTGPENCAQSADGLDGPRRLTVSPNNNSLYVASTGDDAVTRFARNTTTGALTPQGCVDDNDTGPEACAQSTDGLDFASAVTVSPSNNSVYATSSVDDAVVRFNRDPTTGALTPKGCVDDRGSPGGAEDCLAAARGLDGANAVVVSADNKSVYVTSGGDDDALVHFERAASGALAPDGCVDDNDTGGDACAQTTDGLDGATAVAVSADRKSVYVAALHDGAILRLKRALTD